MPYKFCHRYNTRDITCSCSIAILNFMMLVYIVLCLYLQVFQPDGNNGYNVTTEEEAIVEQQRNRPKKLSPRMR